MTILETYSVDLSARMLIGVLFSASGASKFLDNQSFLAVLVRFDLLPNRASVLSVVALAIPILESMVGALLIVGVFFPTVLTFSAGTVSAAMLLCFSSAIALNLKRGRRNMSCGCFGSAKGDTLSWTLVFRNCVLIMLSYAAISTLSVQSIDGQVVDSETRIGASFVGLAVLLVWQGLVSIIKLRTYQDRPS